MMHPDQTGLADEDVEGEIHHIVFRVSANKERNTPVTGDGRLQEVLETDPLTARFLHNLGVHGRQESSGPQAPQRLRREYPLRKDHYPFEAQPCDFLVGLHPAPREERQLSQIRLV